MYRSAIAGPDESVQYVGGGSTASVYRGGSRSWRTHNPGELGHGLIAMEHGAIGRVGGLAVFASRAAGRRALEAVLAGRELAPLTVEIAYRRFDIGYRSEQPPLPPSAPPDAPPPEPVCPHTGLTATRMMSGLAAAERERMADAIEHALLGWREGTITEEALAGGSLNEARRQGGGQVLINGRSAVHAGSQGRLTTPDACNTPAGDGCTPVLYANAAVSADAAGTAATVRINGHPACIQSSRFARSSGDEGGRCGGVVSGTTRGAAYFLTGSGDVTFEGEAAVRQFDLMVSNERNTPAMPLMQPGSAPPPQLLAEAPGESEASAGPNALRVELAACATHHLPATLRVDTHEARHDTALPSGRGTRAQAPLVVAGLAADARPALALAIPGGETGVITVPLAEALASAPFDPDGDPQLAAQAGQHVLVPVVFARALEADASAHAPVRAGGRLCLFRDGRLWRELAVVGQGWYREVDLATHRGADARPAEGVAMSHVLLPARLEGRPQRYEIAYSEIAWSEARLAALEADAGERARRCTPVDPEAGERSEQGDTRITLPDPLARARDHAHNAYALLEERTLLEQARGTGTPALAGLVKALVDADAQNRAERPGEVAGEPLAEQIDQAKLEGTLADWQAFDDALGEAYEDSANELIAVLEEDTTPAVLADYFHDDATPRQRLLGAVHLAWLLGAASTPAARRFVAGALDGAIPELDWLARPPEALAGALHAHATGERRLTESAPDLQHLPPALLGSLVARAGDSLDALLQAIAESQLQQSGDDSARAAAAIAEVVSRYTQVELALVHVPATALLATSVNARAHSYVYRPPEYARHLERLARVRLPQIAPREASDIPRNAEALREHPLYRHGLYGALGVLHGVNAAVAVNTMVHRQDTESYFGFVGSLGAMMAFYGQLAETIYSRRGAQIESRLMALRGERSLLEAESRTGPAASQRASKRLTLVADEINRLRVEERSVERLARAGAALRIIGGSLAATMDIALGVSHTTHGVEGGNAAFAAGGALETLGGITSLAGTALGTGRIALLLGRITLPGLAGALGASLGLVVVGGLLVIVGLLTQAFSRDGPLVRALRFGTFGTHPDPSYYDAYAFAQAEPFRDEALLPGVTLDLADRESELDELYRLLYAFDATVRIHPLDTSNRRPIRGRAPRGDHLGGGVYRESVAEYVVEARIRLAAVTPRRTRLDATLTLERTSALWHEADVAHHRLGDPTLKVCEFREGERLTALACYARVSREAIEGGARLRLRLDVNGDGRHTVPKDGDFAAFTASAGRFHEPMTLAQWHNIEANALAPARLRAGAPADEQQEPG